MLSVFNSGLGPLSTVAAGALEPDGEAVDASFLSLPDDPQAAADMTSPVLNVNPNHFLIFILNPS
jgi:hypothetical protein